MTNRRTRWSQTAEESSAKRSLASDSRISPAQDWGRCPLWVRSDISERIRGVRFAPESGHAELPDSMSAKCQ